MNEQFFWLAVGIIGILGAVVPAAQMGTEIYFDFQLFMLVVGIGIFYVIGSGGPVSYTHLTLPTTPYV